VAESAERAVREAREIGFPVVLKVHSETVTHKSDVGGVALDLPDEAAVRAAFESIRRRVAETAGERHFQGVAVQPMVRAAGTELILGSSVDPQFGPVLLFGAGGRLVEVLRDRALGLPPLNTALARRMVERTRIHAALRGVRGARPVDLEALAELMVRFSQLVVEQPRIREIDVNPLLASPDGLLALDARVLLHDPSVAEADLPRPAIRPYPFAYDRPWTAKDGTRLRIRPIRPEDEPRIARFHETLSDRTVYRRYLREMRLSHRIAQERLRRVCFNDYDREIALVAVVEDGAPEEGPIVGVGRFTRLRWTNEARFGLVVTDLFQGQGLGSEMLRRMVDLARTEGVERIVLEVSRDNAPIQRMLERLGFRLGERPDTALLHAELALR
jgi:acetyltransferase